MPSSDSRGPNRSTHTVVVPVSDRDPVGGQGAQQRRLLSRDVIHCPKPFEMRLGDERHDPYVGVSDPAELGDLTGLARSHLDNREAVLWLKT